MNRERLTIGRINALTLPAGKQQDFLWDTEMPRLAVRVTAGAKVFIFESKLNRQTIRITIGPMSAWRIDDARAYAAELQTMVNKGIDPRQAKADRLEEAVQRKAETKRKSVLVREAWADYLNYLQTARSPKTGKPRSERYLRDHANLSAEGGASKKRGGGTTVAGPLASLMPLQLGALMPNTIAGWLAHESAQRPTVAAHAYRLLRAFVTWLERSEYKGIVAADACTNGEVKEQLPRSEAREGDSLQREMLKPWFEAVCLHANPVQAAYLIGLLLTGARREELAGLRWEDVDFRWYSMRIADKIENERIIPLTPYLASLLAALPRRNEWVFSSVASASGRIPPVSGLLR